MQGQTQLLRPVTLLVEHDHFVEGHLLVVIGDNHELKLEPQRHMGDPQRNDLATVSVPAYQPTASAPTLSCPPDSCCQRRRREWASMPSSRLSTRRVSSSSAR